jgi:hypothetical protein
MRRGYYRFNRREGRLNASAVLAWGRLAAIALGIGRKERTGVADWGELRHCAEAVRELPVIGVYDATNACHRLRMEAFAALSARTWRYEQLALLAETVADAVAREQVVAEAQRSVG